MTDRRLDSALRQEAERGLVGAARFLLAHRRPDGAIHRACAGRAVESALALHLTRGLPGRRIWHERLRAFCEQAWSESEARPERSPLRRFDRSVRRALLALALATDAETRAAAVAELRGALAQFQHPSRERKIALFSTLVAELDPSHRWTDPVRYRGARDIEAGWTRLLLLALDILGRAVDGRSSEEAEVDELVAGQMADGCWYRHHFLTVVALMALRRAAPSDPALERGLDYLERATGPDGGLPFIPDLDIFTSGISGFFLARGGWGCEVLPVGRFLLRHQMPNGTWCFSPGVVLEDVDDTGVVATCLEALDEREFDSAIERALAAILEFRNADGGFTTYVRGAASEVEITARAIQALGARPQRHRDSIDAAVRWLESAQSPGGEFGFEWTLSPEFPLCQVALALSRSGVDGARAGRIRQRVARYLLERQRTDGGWSDESGASEVLPSGYALIALAAIRGPAVGEAIDRGLRFILRRQRDDGGFASPPDEIAPRPLIYEMALFPTMYALGALVLCLRADDGLSAWEGAWRPRISEGNVGGDGRNRTGE